MANSRETTFQTLQMDERYKKLERTLKMVLLKNADRRNTGTWPTVSSINGDNFDTSCAAMSIQSSRVGSEVVASSANFRNAAQPCNKYQERPRLKMVTSSENQFSTKKDATDDSAMMPPPSTPSSWFTSSKRFGKDSQHAPLRNMPPNPTKNNNGFAISTPVSSISSIIKQTGSMSIDTNTDYQGDDKYGRNVYQENANDNGSQPRQRIFSRWRVLLNDKGLLIIKGTLECGKIARSKPVIRRLTPTSVQSVFKHTYHLQGNLIDERNELPDYVRGKFFNGFPDDWENVYQVWQNYRSDGSRLSFHWPTAVTDSDDDIKSGITEISYNSLYGKHKKSVSPRKRAGSKASSSVRATTERDAENPSDQNRCSCSHNASLKPPETLTRVNSKRNRDEDGMSVNLEEKAKVHDTSCRSLNTTDKVGALSLKDILQEDKLNIIIDNLTNKNCSIEYIKKVVEMFDGIKYLVSYQSTDENDSDKNNSVSQEKDIYRRPKKENRQTEEKQSSRSRSNNLHNPTAKIDRCENAPSNFGNGFASRIAEKSYKDQDGGQARRILAKRNYDSSESENDCQNDNRRPRTYHPTSSHERVRRSPRHNKNYQNGIANRASERHTEPKQSFEGSHRARKCNVLPASRSNIRDSSLSEEEPVVDRRVEQKTQQKRAFASPRKRRNAEKDSRRRVNHHDSSVSITDDEYDHLKKSKPKNAYDSNVEGSSLSEDEHGDTRREGRRVEALKHYPAPNSRPVEPDSRGTVDIRGDRKKVESSKDPESIFRPVDPAMSRNNSRQDTPREAPKFSLAAVEPPAKNSVNNDVGINNFATEQDDDSAYLSSDIKRAKKLEINCDAVETSARKAYTVSRSNDQLDQPSTSSEMPAPKRKSPQVRKMPVVVRCEPTNINLKSHICLRSSGGNENDKNACNAQRVRVDRSKVNPAPNDPKNAPVSQKTPVDTLSERANIAGPTVTKSTNKEAKVALKAPDGKSSTTENKSEKAGSQANPKLLTAWVPAVVRDDKGDSKYHLIFEGKLLNEAGHVVNRKFATDFIRRRVTAELVETINQEFYKLVGDFNDTKHVVPKELVKLCRGGCPGQISRFCERWTNLTTEPTKDQPRDLPHNTTLDCLGVPTSSRGRSIVPPLNYWAGERIATKDNKAIYSPGNAPELKNSSALDSTNDDIRDKKSPSKLKQVQNSVDQNGKHTDESKATGTKRKEAEKVSSSKPAIQNPSQSEKRRSSNGGKRRLSKNVQASSSESEADEKKKPIPRKRKARTIDQMLNTESTSTKKLKNSCTNNPASSQNLKSTNASSGRGSLEKLPETKPKAKLGKRQKIDYDQSPVTPTTSKQFPTRRKSMITCTYYKNVPIRDDDLSEDQLSTM